MWSIASILTQRDGSNEMVRSSWFRSQTQNHYFWIWILDLTLIFHVCETFNFQFPSKTHFLDQNFQDPSCRICSYGPQGPFWFSAKTWPDTVKRYQKNETAEKSVFEITVKMNLFCGGKFWKAPLCLWSSRRGFYFWKTNILEFLRHANFGEIALCSYLVIQEALRRLSKAICWGTTPRQLRGSPRGTKCARSCELGNTVITPQCKHCFGKNVALTEIRKSEFTPYQSPKWALQSICILWEAPEIHKPGFVPYQKT